MHRYANGRLPASALKAIPGNGRLWAPAAQAFIAMAALIRIKTGVSMAIIEGSMRRTYRELVAQQYARRYWCGLGKCGNAAVPGTSNHGLGLAGDLMSWAQRAAVDRWGRPFGWAKAWSDAPWEWWHFKWREGVWTPPKPKRYPRTLRYHDSGPTVEKLQGWLRARGRTSPEHPNFKLYRAVPAKGRRGRGYYGRSTRRAVVQFQKGHHLTPDGVVGPKTWRALGVRPS